MPVPGAEEFTLWMGWTFIAFGTYRLILYTIRSRQETEPENDEQN